LVVTGGAQTIEFADGSAAAPSITNSGDTNTGIFFPAADTISFTESGVESMRITDVGNVAIGQNSSASQFLVKGSSTGKTVSQFIANDTQTTTMAVWERSDGAVSSRLIYDGTGLVKFGTSTAHPLVFDTNNTERMRITSAGELLVGGTTSTGLVNFQIQTGNTSASNAGFQILNSTTGTGGLYYGDSTTGTGRFSGFIEYSNGSDSMFFGTAASERMRIDSSGNLLVNTTTNGGSDKAIFAYTDASTNGVGIRETSDASGTTFLSFRASNSGLCGRVTRVGTTNAVAYNTSSDYRLKENIAPMTGALDKVAALKPVTYDWKAGGSSQGFIAHELQAIVPDCVTGEKDGMRTEQYEVSPAIEATYDEEGNELTPAVEAVMGEREVPDYQGIDTSFLVATLTAAIQEQQAIITDLKARIETLENT
jgi:hypothetical protein